jgi:hypothetical protein
MGRQLAIRRHIMSVSIRLRCALALTAWATLLGACSDDGRDGGVIIVGDDGAVEGGIGTTTTGGTSSGTTGQTTGATTSTTGGTTAATTGAPPPTPPGPTTP